MDGRLITNPASSVLTSCSIVVRAPRELRGSAKLRAALDAFGVDPSGRVCVDVGAAAGGFTTVLLARGARRVYAVDVGHGQLLGSLRQDPRVVDLEATNVSDLDGERIADPVSLIVVDVSYLSLSSAVSQLGRLELDDDAELVGLVKPMFELRLPRAPTTEAGLEAAIGAARGVIDSSGWDVVATMQSPVRGSGGSIEGFVHARPS